MLAGAPIVEISHVEKAKMQPDRHIPPWWIVRFHPSSGRRLLIVFSVCVASVIRVPYIAHMSLVDASWSDAHGGIWTVVELNLGIVSACLPTLRLLFLHVFHGGYTARANRQKLPEKPSMVAGNESPDVISMTEALDTTPIVVSRTSDVL